MAWAEPTVTDARRDPQTCAESLSTTATLHARHCWPSASRRPAAGFRRGGTGGATHARTVRPPQEARAWLPRPRAPAHRLQASVPLVDLCPTVDSEGRQMTLTANQTWCFDVAPGVAAAYAVSPGRRHIRAGRAGCARGKGERQSADIDDPANRGPVGEALQPVRDAIEAEPLAHQGLGNALRDELRQLVMAHAHQSRVLGRVKAPVQSDDRVVLDQRVVERGRLDLPSREADHQDSAFKSYALGRALVGVSTNRVIHHVGTMAAGDVLDHRNEVLRMPVHDDVSAQFPRHLSLFGPSYHADRVGAGRLAELDRGTTDPARSGVHEQGLTWLQVRAAVQSEPSGLVADVESSRLRIVEPVRSREGRCGVHERELREPT